MDAWVNTIDTPLEWLGLVVLFALFLGIYFSLLWLIRKYTTGIFGGFLLLLFGFFISMGSAFHLITTENSSVEIMALSFVIVAGCVTLIVGAFKLANFWDF